MTNVSKALLNNVLLYDDTSLSITYAYIFWFVLYTFPARAQLFAC